MIDKLKEISEIEKQINELVKKKSDLISKYYPDLIQFSPYKVNDVLSCNLPIANYKRIITTKITGFNESGLEFEYLTVDLYGDFKTFTERIDFTASTDLK